MQIKYKIETLAGGQVVHLIFNSQRDLCSSMLRIEEFYESPEFAGQFFSLAEYKEWYKVFTNKKTFTYYSNWAGFNIPVNTARKFLDVFRGDLTQVETNILLDFFSHDNPRYLIASYGGSSSRDVVEHELAHAAFSISSGYKAQVDSIIDTLPTSVIEDAKQKLRDKGYAEHVLIDEIQAYAVDKASKFEGAEELRENFLIWIVDNS